MLKEKQQDYVYLQEDYYKNPKEIFYFVAKLMNSNNFSCLDLGCARGEFLYYLKQNFDTTKLLGVDYSEVLIDKAQEYEGLNGVDFYVDSAETFNSSNKFDFVTLLGTISYFDDTYFVLETIKKHLKSNGRAFILSCFNFDDVDVLVKYRNNKIFKTDEFERGWNRHSIETIKKNLFKLGMKLVDVHNFELSFKLQKQEDPSRAWNIETEYGRKWLNGLGFLYDLSVLEIENI